MRRVLVTIAAAIALTLGTAPAGAATTGPYVYNPPDFPVWVDVSYWVDDAHTTRDVDQVPPGSYSERGAYAFRVASGTRIYYKSLATGAYYWSRCGVTATTWEYIGNSVRLVSRDTTTCS